MLQRPKEINPWQTGLHRTFQAHDGDTVVETQQKNYFGPGQFYCVETICAPCGVVIAWTKFDKLESPTKTFFKPSLSHRRISTKLYLH